VVLVKGNLENEETDVIINLTDSKVKNEGAQSKRLAEKAGLQFKEECTRVRNSIDLYSPEEGSCF